jgi:thiosulfate/3-mercaptopyruvate sulfurtransferase
MQLRFITAAMITAALTGSAWAVNLPGPVVDTQWLAKNRAEVQIVDVRSENKSFTAQPIFETDKKSGKKTLSEIGGHLADALPVAFGSIRSDRVINGQKVSYLLPEKADFEKLMQTAGLRADRPIVIVTKATDPSEVDEGLRLLWQLKYFGEDRVAVLDGGMAAWLTEGRDVVVTPQTPAAGDWKATSERKELLATPDEVAKASNDVQLIDARAAAQYYGIGKRDYVLSFGHIKGAKLLPPEVLFRKDGMAVKFFSPETYRSIFAMSGLNADQPGIAYCNSGHLAAGPWFIEHELVGNKQARLFDGSMHIWTLQKRPVEGVALAPLPATCAPDAKTPGC